MTGWTSAGFRRLVLGLDASAPAIDALEALAQLAARLDAELVGLFVEEAALLACAGLPLARVVDAVTAAPRALGPEEMEQSMRLAAARARRALEAAAEGARVRWSFRVARGRPSREILAAAGDAGVACVAPSGWAPAPRTRLGSTARELLRASEAAHVAPAVLILTDARRIATSRPAYVDDGSVGAAVAADVAERLVVHGAERPLGLRPRSGASLAALARAAGAGCLVLSPDQAAELDLEALARDAGCALLLLS